MAETNKKPLGDNFQQPPTDGQPDGRREKCFRIDAETGKMFDITDPENPVEVIIKHDSDLSGIRVCDSATANYDSAASRLSGIRVYDSAAARAARIEKENLTVLRSFAVASAESFNSVATQIMRSIQDTIPISPDTLQLMGEAMRKWARENIILLNMVQHWKEGHGVDLLDDDSNPIYTDTEDNWNRLIDALQIIAAAYSDTHSGIGATISDDGTTFDLPPEVDAEINALVDEYSDFHNSSGAESYVFTAQLFAKTHFQSTDPNEIIVSDRITAISLKDFQFALTTRPNPTAFIAPLGTGAFTRFRYDDATGQVINVKTGQPVQETQTPTETASMMKTAADTVTTPDFVLLTALYSVLLRNAERFEGDNIIVPIKPFARELGVDLGGGIGHVKDLEKRFQVYDPYVGWINGQGLFAVLKFIKRDDTNGTMTFSAPYLNRLLTLVQQRGTRTFKSGRKTFLGHNELVHTSIYKERNQTAAAIVIHICDLLLQNSQQPDRKKGETHVISHIAFSTLADYAEFAPRIERTTATREKTRMLKACFTKALELLRTRSDAYQYFDGLELYTIGKDGKTKTFATVKDKNGELLDNLTGGKEKYNAIAPTFAGYKGILYIRHRGANKNWKHGD